MIVYLEFECILYEGKSLKNKRSVIKRLISRLRQDLNIAIAELDYQDLWQRSKIGIVTIANQYKYAEKVIQEVLKIVDSFPEIERTLTKIEHL